jgi:general secretion pathway protein E
MNETEFPSLLKKFSISTVNDIKNFPFVQEKKVLLPYLFAKQNSVLPIEEKDHFLVVAMGNPFQIVIIEEMKLILNRELEIIYCPKGALEEAIELCYRQKEEVTKKLLQDLQSKSKIKEGEEETEGYDLLERSIKNPVIHMLDSIFLEAIQQEASDIHFEPQENGLQIRYRIDGILLERHIPPKEYQAQMITRIKVMAKLDIAEHRLPQDGRIKLKMGGREIDFRVSTTPVVYGERIVLRILDRSNIILGLHQIGMQERMFTEFSQMIDLPEGIVLVTGPTGSGKTTTLYSAISEIHSSEMNIMTIEDPVEYKLPYIAQIGVNTKIHLDFATGLRSILRQDPDIIMVGEIRDGVTAEIAIQAALTGHLVLSTLHTNDAPSALARLADMGIEPYLLSSSIVGVLAQRLVRKICPKCRETYQATAEELKLLDILPSELPQGLLFRGKGCPFCLGTGYKGRHGIYELMPVNSLIKRQIMKSVDAEEIRRVALNEGMSDLRSSGKALILEGVTTSFEVLRVTKALCRGV